MTFVTTEKEKYSKKERKKERNDCKKERKK